MKINDIKLLSNDLHRYRTHAIEQTLPSDGFVLEIGPNVTALEYEKNKCTVISLDINPNVPSDVLGNTEYIPFNDSVFDFIIATEIIEHVRYPKRMLNEICRVGKKYGHVLLSTPNVAHLTNRFGMLFFGDFYDDRCLHDTTDVGHIHFFSRKYFITIVKEQNLIIEKEWNHFIPITSKHYIDSNLWSRLFKNLTKQTVLMCRINK